MCPRSLHGPLKIRRQTGSTEIWKAEIQRRGQGKSSRVETWKRDRDRGEKGGETWRCGKIRAGMEGDVEERCKRETYGGEVGGETDT